MFEIGTAAFLRWVAAYRRVAFWGTVPSSSSQVSVASLPLPQFPSIQNGVRLSFLRALRSVDKSCYAAPENYHYHKVILCLIADCSYSSETTTASLFFAVATEIFMANLNRMLETKWIPQMTLCRCCIETSSLSVKKKKMMLRKEFSGASAFRSNLKQF